MLQCTWKVSKLFIRSNTEYSTVVFHGPLTVEQSKAIENIQFTALKIIYKITIYLPGLREK